MYTAFSDERRIKTEHQDVYQTSLNLKYSKLTKQQLDEVIEHITVQSKNNDDVPSEKEFLEFLRMQLKLFPMFETSPLSWYDETIEIMERVLGYNTIEVALLFKIRQSIINSTSYGRSKDQAATMSLVSVSTANFLERLIKDIETGVKKKNVEIFQPIAQPPTKSFWDNTWVSGTGTKLLAEIIKWVVVSIVGSITLSGVVKYFNQEVKLSMWVLALLLFGISIVVFFLFKLFAGKSK